MPRTRRRAFSIVERMNAGWSLEARRIVETRLPHSPREGKVGNCAREYRVHRGLAACRALRCLVPEPPKSLELICADFAPALDLLRGAGMRLDIIWPADEPHS